MSGDDVSFSELLSLPPMTWTGDGALEAVNAGLPPGHYGGDAPPRSPPSVVTAVDAGTGTITLEAWRGIDRGVTLPALREGDLRYSFADLFEREVAAALEHLDERDAAFDRFGYGATRWTWRFARRLAAAIGAL